MKRVITYSTYNLLHYGHIALLKRTRALGDFLMAALSSDEFNAGKGKQSYSSYEEYKVMFEAIRYVDLVVPELTWGRKIEDIVKYGIDVSVTGDNWNGEFDDQLKELYEAVYLLRILEVSTARIKNNMRLG